MTLPLIINPLAEADLAEAREWYEDRRSGLGDELVECVEDALLRIQEQPKVPAKIFADIRRGLVKRFPYGVYYRVDSEQITVVAVYHARRDPRGWQDRV